MSAFGEKPTFRHEGAPAAGEGPVLTQSGHPPAGGPRRSKVRGVVDGIRNFEAGPENSLAFRTHDFPEVSGPLVIGTPRPRHRKSHRVIDRNQGFDRALVFRQA